MKKSIHFYEELIAGKSDDRIFTKQIRLMTYDYAAPYKLDLKIIAIFSAKFIAHVNSGYLLKCILDIKTLPS